MQIRAVTSFEEQDERLRAYREAPTEQRCAMIRAHYAQLRAERIARYELRNGPGSFARRAAELAARPMPEVLTVAGQQSRDYWGTSRGGVWS